MILDAESVFYPRMLCINILSYIIIVNNTVLTLAPLSLRLCSQRSDFMSKLFSKNQSDTDTNLFIACKAV